ncbi:hypothetical protein HDU77_008158 [Chytriomyces hyalinus]|nr:hypothetical protein HDU77_008158 [Chytriomyces hyalinus]
MDIEDSSHVSNLNNQSTHNNIVKDAVSHWIRFTRVQIALRARNEKLKRETLLKWRGYRLMQWRQMDAAKSRANLTLVRTALNYWFMYNDHRRIRNLKKRFALNSRESMLSTRVFKLWTDKFRFRRQIQLLDLQSIHCESARTSKSYFSHWLSALRKRREQDAKVERSKEK